MGWGRGGASTSASSSQWPVSPAALSAEGLACLSPPAAPSPGPVVPERTPVTAGGCVGAGGHIALRGPVPPSRGLLCSDCVRVPCPPRPGFLWKPAARRALWCPRGCPADTGYPQAAVPGVCRVRPMPSPNWFSKSEQERRCTGQALPIPCDPERVNREAVCWGRGEGGTRPPSELRHHGLRGLSQHVPGPRLASGAAQEAFLVWARAGWEGPHLSPKVPGWGGSEGHWQQRAYPCLWPQWRGPCPAPAGTSVARALAARTHAQSLRTEGRAASRAVAHSVGE